MSTSMAGLLDIQMWSTGVSTHKGSPVRYTGVVYAVLGLMRVHMHGGGGLSDTQVWSGSGGVHFKKGSVGDVGMVHIHRDL